MNRKLMRFGAAVLATGLVAASCSGDGSDAGSPTSTTGSLVVDLSNAVPIGNLRAFNECEELHTYFTSNVVSMIDSGWFSQGPYYIADDGAVGVDTLEAPAATTNAASGGSDSGDSGSSKQPVAGESGDSASEQSADGAIGGEAEGSFSGTNNQEEGVDEPDLVKTNGEIMVTVTGQVLTVLDVSDGGLTKLGEVQLESWSRDLLMVGDRVLVLGEDTSYYELYDDVAVSLPAPAQPLPELDADTDADLDSEFVNESDPEDAEGSEPDSEADFVREDVGDASNPIPVEPPFEEQWRQRSALTEIDISNPANPTIVQRLVVDGNYLSAREIGGVVRVVVQMSPQNIYPQTWYGNAEVPYEDAVANLRNDILETSLDYWVPSYSLVDAASGEVTAEGRLLECSDVSHPETFSGYGTLSVLTVDMNDGLSAPSSAVGVVAGGNTVYASPESLYVATGQWWRWDVGFAPGGDGPPAEMTTEIHKFDISNPEATEYVGSGSIGGYLLNQFSMSEHNGDLRLASTSQPNFGWCCEEGDQELPESQVVVLRMDGDRLEQIGAVGGLGKGETIHSVRFMGDLGYVVTFRQTDPLYVVDLSDPTSPTVEGELKINGFSSYLHPLEDGLLLGVGQDATDEGQTTGTQISIFDVSDPKNPTRVQQYTFPDSYSNAEWDHHAFLYWAADNMLVLPLQTYSWDGPTAGEDFFTGAVVLNVDGASEITERGRVSQPVLLPAWFEEELARAEQEGYEDELLSEVGYFQPQIDRSVVVDGSLYTISQGGIMSSDMASLVQTGWIATEGNW